MQFPPTARARCRIVRARFSRWREAVCREMPDDAPRSSCLARLRAPRSHGHPRRAFRYAHARGARASGNAGRSDGAAIAAPRSHVQGAPEWSRAGNSGETRETLSCRRRLHHRLGRIQQRHPAGAEEPPRSFSRRVFMAAVRHRLLFARVIWWRTRRDAASDDACRTRYVERAVDHADPGDSKRAERKRRARGRAAQEINGALSRRIRMVRARVEGRTRQGRAEITPAGFSARNARPPSVAAEQARARDTQAKERAAAALQPSRSIRAARSRRERCRAPEDRPGCPADGWLAPPRWRSGRSRNTRRP